MTRKINTDLVAIWTTVADEMAGERIARSLLENRLAACVQIDAPMISHYVWEGQHHADVERRVVIKTLASKAEEVSGWLAKNHPYQTPQIMVMSVLDAHPAYAQWVRSQIEDGS